VISSNNNNSTNNNTQEIKKLVTPSVFGHVPQKQEEKPKVEPPKKLDTSNLFKQPEKVQPPPPIIQPKP